MSQVSHNTIGSQELKKTSKNMFKNVQNASKIKCNT